MKNSSLVGKSIILLKYDKLIIILIINVIGSLYLVVKIMDYFSALSSRSRIRLIASSNGRSLSQKP